MITSFISQHPKYNFLYYLNSKQNGSRHNLTNQIILLEKQTKIPAIGMHIFTKIFDNKIWEIPTNELCQGLVILFGKLNIRKINELAAGNGLLSARLKYFATKMNYVLDIDTSDGTNKMFGKHPFTFVPVREMNIRCYDKSEPIIISWLHCQFEDELLKSIKKHKQDYIFLIGDYPDFEGYNNTHSRHFHSKITSYKYGYWYKIISFNQLSQMDYFVGDKIRKDIFVDCRTCVTLYYRIDREYNIAHIVNTIDSMQYEYPNLFGNYMDKNREYYDQDWTVLKSTDNIIKNYMENDYQGLDSIIIDGLKPYAEDKFYVERVNMLREKHSDFDDARDLIFMDMFNKPYRSSQWSIPKYRRFTNYSTESHLTSTAISSASDSVYDDSSKIISKMFEDTSKIENEFIEYGLPQENSETTHLKFATQLYSMMMQIHLSIMFEPFWNTSQIKQKICRVVRYSDHQYIYSCDDMLFSSKDYLIKQNTIQEINKNVCFSNHSYIDHPFGQSQYFRDIETFYNILKREDKMTRKIQNRRIFITNYPKNNCNHKTLSKRTRYH
ncbi:hypothetical protein QJ850_gp151 [Acanthamoeba polyphaga mimivirus]|uniref:Uncharacterized protein n=1 Tax=Acanthamoeba polyphaga mimivirus Kroon TaxID=3069720 RepID=A0A0G2Y425_9VIRU|nr:hypothetical protein QJ850_gp151 [Acanthamoeba polyphaga mimivirus]AKI80548.1 hypothetical protein [Acanthamoeba polyphaga mimivirus Kroon]